MKKYIVVLSNHSSGALYKRELKDTGMYQYILVLDNTQKLTQDYFLDSFDNITEAESYAECHYL